VQQGRTGAASGIFVIDVAGFFADIKPGRVIGEKVARDRAFNIAEFIRAATGRQTPTETIPRHGHAPIRDGKFPASKIQIPTSVDQSNCAVLL
jgi:hypothetical protein